MYSCMLCLSMCIYVVTFSTVVYGFLVERKSGQEPIDSSVDDEMVSGP